MKSLLFPIFFAGILCQTSHSAVVFEPQKLNSSQGTWHKTDGNFKGEHYYDYFYDNQVVFRILGRFKPAVDAKIKVAIVENAQLRLASTTIIYFDSTKLIEENFSIVPNNDEEITIDPEMLLFDIETSGCLGRDKTYFVGFSEDDIDIEISKSTYTALLIAKRSASAKGKFLQINLSQLKKTGAIKKKLATLVEPQPKDNQACAVCMDKEKTIMIEPCNHVCVCEKCSSEIKDNCPICQGVITSKKRVFY